MHKPFYASGFLYHAVSQQILLYQPDEKNKEPIFWRMLGGESQEEETPEKAIQRIVSSLVKIKLSMRKILPVYDYFHPTRKKNHYVFYAEIGHPRNFRSFRHGTLCWFTFKKTMKLPLTAETKQDIIVSERVIRAVSEANIPRTVILQK